MWFGDSEVALGGVVNLHVVVGLGATGISCMRHLKAAGKEVIAMDSAKAPTGVQVLQQEFPDVKCVVSELDPAILGEAEEIIVSPGVPVAQQAFAGAKAKGIPIIGDIELFVREAKAPIYAVTGSNGKTTVTTLLGLMAEKAGRRMAVAGNIGKPVLELLQEDYEGYILELSSFQLETTDSLAAKAAVVLNVTPDHMDRYTDFEAYRAAKHKIYHHCDNAIVNLDSPDIWQPLDKNSEMISFSLLSQQADYYLQDNKLMQRGKVLVEVKQLALQGQHHYQNALASLAMGEVMGLPVESMLSVLAHFTGLSHRCQLVKTIRGVSWYNDSKATNVGATETAIKSIGELTEGRLLLLAGGQSKGADFSALRSCVASYVSDVILFGEDKEQLARVLNESARLHHVDSLQQAVRLAAELSQSGDQVLLSPACASFDMFANFADRGDQFIKAVEAL